MAVVDKKTGKTGPGRPRKNPPPFAQEQENVEMKNKRTPIDGQRDKLALNNLDPDFYYYWVVDQAEDGQRIAEFLDAGYTFVRPEEGVRAGQADVYTSSNVGSIIRVTAGRTGGYHYLMKLPMEYRKEDLARKAREVDATEETMRADIHDGQYGEIKISR